MDDLILFALVAFYAMLLTVSYFLSALREGKQPEIKESPKTWRGRW